MSIQCLSLGLVSSRSSRSFRGFQNIENVAQACVSELFGRPARPELGSGSLRSHLSRENLVRGHFRGHFGVTWVAQNSAWVTSGSIRGHRTRPELGSGSLRGHFWVTWLEKTRLGVTSKPLGSRKLGSGSLRGHVAREDSARVHFEATWLEKTRLGVTSRPPVSRKLGSGSLRGHLTRGNLARSHLEATWLETTRLAVTSRPLGSRKLRLGATSRPLGSLGLPWLCLARLGFAQFALPGSHQPSSACLDPRGLTQLGLVRSCSKKLFETTVLAPLSFACLDTVSSETRMDILGFTLVYILSLIHI